MTAAAQPKKSAEGEPGRVERTAEFSEQVLEQVKESQESALEAVRGFMESVDEALPGESPSRRQDVVDSALRMSEKLVRTQYDFLTNVVRGASEALGASDEKE
jgi:hypothetical protein